MNLSEWRDFAEQTKTEQGAIVSCDMIVSLSLIDDTDIDLQALLAGEFERGARDFYDREDCEYTHIKTLGPFEYRYIPGDIPADARCFVGRVRVRRVDKP